MVVLDIKLETLLVLIRSVLQLLVEMRLTIPGIGQTSELILNNVQGEFVVGAAKTLFFFNSSGISTELNSSGAAGLGTGGDVQISNIKIDTDGLHINVNHQNHGMCFANNQVRFLELHLT